MQAVTQLHPHPNPTTYKHTYINTYIHTYIYIYIIKISYPVHKAPPPTGSGRGD